MIKIPYKPVIRSSSKIQEQGDASEEKVSRSTSRQLMFEADSLGSSVETKSSSKKMKFVDTVESSEDVIKAIPLSRLTVEAVKPGKEMSESEESQ